MALSACPLATCAAARCANAPGKIVLGKIVLSLATTWKPDVRHATWGVALPWCALTVLLWVQPELFGALLRALGDVDEHSQELASNILAAVFGM